MQASKFIKIERYESNILQHLCTFLNKEVYNKVLKKASFTYCRLSRDFSMIKIYVDCINREDLDKIVLNLNKFKGSFRTEIAKNFDFRKTPTIEFLRDTSIDRAKEIEDILSDLKGN
ncbi:MAG: 30S ribosome-binding factor RbfA [Mycoplasmoidaceae bacterium]